MVDDLVEPKPGPGWRLNPHNRDGWECEQYFAADGECIAVVEGPDGDDAPSYPHAFDPVEKVWKRGGAYRGLVEAKAWAERIAGISPRKSDEDTGVPHHPMVGRYPSERF